MCLVLLQTFGAVETLQIERKKAQVRRETHCDDDSSSDNIDACVPQLQKGQRCYLLNVLDADVLVSIRDKISWAMPKKESGHGM